jgi:predicted aspartyl protease
MIQRLYLVTFLFVFIIISSCTTHWTKAIRSGSVLNEPFTETIKFEEKLGLIIVPVEINGKTYRFLWDTGATSSISEELQGEFQFKTVSKSNISDTDGNQKKVRYVKVGTIHIGDIEFIEQVAFVADFKANPTIGCLNIDGIVGGNLMRLCNWTVDYAKDEILISSSVPEEFKANAIQLPFTYDSDFDIKLNLKIGRAKVSNLDIDYGSNGSLTFPQRILDVLKKNGIVTETFLQTGTKNSGLIGIPIKINREFAYTDSLFIGDQMLQNVEIKVGNHALIGMGILSRYVVTIAWDDQRIYFNDYSSDPDQNETFGFALGVRGADIYVQSVFEHSDASHKGLKPEMVVTRLNSLDFTKSAIYCDYIDLMNSDPDELTLEYKDEEGNLKTVTIKSQSLRK